MTANVGHGVIRVNGIRLHYLKADDEGPPMVLLHGWPQTSYAWRKVLPTLAERYRVIAPDLRGMGHSDKPASGYDLRTLASDFHALCLGLNLERPYLMGHDWEGLVARRYALEWLGQASRVAVLNIVPHEQVLSNLTADVAGKNWHYFLNAVPDSPEALVEGNVEAVDVRGRGIEACGHYLAEEQPEIVARKLLAFGVQPVPRPEMSHE